MDGPIPLYQLLLQLPKPRRQQVTLTPPLLCSINMSIIDNVFHQERLGSNPINEHIRCNQTPTSASHDDCQVSNVDRGTFESTGTDQLPVVASNGYSHLVGLLNEALEISESVLNGFDATPTTTIPSNGVSINIRDNAPEIHPFRQNRSRYVPRRRRRRRRYERGCDGMPKHRRPSNHRGQ